ncbi:MAG: hypothetical protein IPP48_17100 [Chitinophagaceae bacterium]|nr:hypothetical protein [Chitinophagaceae bacterium]
MAINLGWGVGGGLGGFIASKNYQSLCWVDGITNIVAAILLLIILPKVFLAQQQKKGKEKQVYASPYKDKSFLYYIFLKLLFATCFFNCLQLFLYFLKKNFFSANRGTAL